MSKRLTIEEFIKTLKSGSGSGDSSGGGSGVLCISSEADSSTATAVLDKTWQEIHDALALQTLKYLVTTPYRLSAETRMQSSTTLFRALAAM